MTEPVRPSVRLGTPGEMALALPMLLGYHPTESLVISALSGPRFAVGLTLRFDLDDLDPFDLSVTELAQRLDVAGADAAFIAVYTDARRVAGQLPYSDLIDALLDEPGLRIRDALMVRRSRWWSYLCEDLDCCPKNGNKLGRQTTELSRLQTALVLSGSAVLEDRAALVSSVAADVDANTTTQRQVMIDALRSVSAMSPAARRSELIAIMDWLVSRFADPRSELDDHDAALVAALIGDVLARDDLLMQAVSPPRREVVLRILRVLVRRIPAPYDAPSATVLAWFAYASGDGTLANIALNRALRSDPDYSLALLIATSLDRQLPPSMLDEVLRGAARDIEARDAAG